MSEKMTMSIDLRNLQEQIEDNVKQVRTLSRKAILREQREKLAAGKK